MNKTIQLTNKGLEALKKELELLVNKKDQLWLIGYLMLVLREIYLKIQIIKTQKKNWNFLEGRIEELQLVIKNAKVVKDNDNGNNVGVGTKVTVRVNGVKNTFEIVGEWEADMTNKKLVMLHH